MKTKIWGINGYTFVKPTDTINTTRRLNAFCIGNSLPNCVYKSQGGWYYIDKKGKLNFIERTLNSITFENLYKLLNK